MKDVGCSNVSERRVTDIENRICHQAAGVCSTALSPHLSALVLTGSMARGEATLVEEGGISQVLGDAEFFVAFKKQAPLASEASLKILAERTQARLSDEGIRCHVEFTPVPPRYFRRLAPSIFAYELRACGRVVWGDPLVLSLIPSFSEADIPREDGWRLLLNRIIECLEVIPGLLQGEAAGAQDFSYRLTKLCLDMATSYLLFAGEFRPTYQARAQVLKEMAQRSKSAERCPLHLSEFSDQVVKCTDFKLGKGQEQPFPDPCGESSVRIFAEAGRLWRWELAQLTGAPASSSNLELMKQWMYGQTISRRARGWVVVLRECNWYKSWRNWPRWFRLARRGSPRHWIYAVASELFFSMSRVPLSTVAEKLERKPLLEQQLSLDPMFQWVDNHREKSAPWELRCSALPIDVQAPPEKRFSEWNNLALSMAANYHRLLEHTES